MFLKILYWPFQNFIPWRNGGQILQAEHVHNKGKSTFRWQCYTVTCLKTLTNTNLSENCLALSNFSEFCPDFDDEGVVDQFFCINCDNEEHAMQLLHCFRLILKGGQKFAHFWKNCPKHCSASDRSFHLWLPAASALKIWFAQMQMSERISPRSVLL